MLDWWRALCGAALVAGFGALPGALAQSGRVWVDPPSNLAELPLPPSEEARPPETSAPEAQAALAPPPLPPQRPEDPDVRIGPVPAGETGSDTGSITPDKPRATTDLAEASSREEIARQFVIDYLAFWSSENVPVRDAVPAFYAPRVEFHGRRMGPAALVRQKTRFARRWPTREYTTRPETMQVTCDPAGRSCTVQSLFDFRAENRSRRRRSEGTGVLELVLTFVDGRPLITSESSLVQTRRREARGRSIGFDDTRMSP